MKTKREGDVAVEVLQSMLLECEGDVRVHQFVYWTLEDAIRRTRDAIKAHRARKTRAARKAAK